ncbi:MAG: c-type cytochrome domain-containing protein, partial [Planctomycetota bacterium]
MTKSKRLPLSFPTEGILAEAAPTDDARRCCRREIDSEWRNPAQSSGGEASHKLKLGRRIARPARRRTWDYAWEGETRLRRRGKASRRMTSTRVALVILLAPLAGPSDLVGAEVEPNSEPAEVAIADLPPDATAQFESDVLPLLERSCLACHNAGAAEADVDLESTEAMLAYDAEDPLIVPGDASASKLLLVAAGRQEPVMPPEDNDVGAAPLTPDELGLIKRWIELGAPSGSPEDVERPIRWRPIRSNHAPIMATAVASRGAFALAAIGNGVEVFNLAQNRRETRLIDASLRRIDGGVVDAAHLDVVRSLATFDNGERIATGGYRTVKLWRRERSKREISWPADAVASAMATSERWIATGHVDGSVILGRRDSNLTADAPLRWEAHAAKVVGLAFESGGEQLASVAADGAVTRWQVPEGEALGAWRLAPPPRRAVLLPDALLATTSDDLVVRIYRLSPGSKKPDDGGEEAA